MSTKIYNGYKLINPPKNLLEIRDIIFEFKENAMQYYREKLLSLVASDIVSMYDNAMFNKKNKWVSPRTGSENKNIYDFIESDRLLIDEVISATRDKADIYKKQSLRSHAFRKYNFCCSVVILPCDNNVFLLLFSDDEKVQNIFESTKGIEKYPYWDNTDQPENVTRKEWEDRREEWNKALPGIAVPSEYGFVIDVVQNTENVIPMIRFRKTDPKPFDESINYLPNFNKRVDRIVADLIWEELDKTVKNYGEVSFYDMMSKFEKYKEDHVEDVAQKKQIVLDTIKIDFTLDDFNISFKDFCQKYNIKKEKD